VRAYIMIFKDASLWCLYSDFQRCSFTLICLH